jgi:hypothetical protein
MNGHWFHTSPRNAWYDAPMSEPPEDTTETPIRRALRLKQAAASAKPQSPRGGKFQRQQTAALASGKSKPWMKR